MDYKPQSVSVTRRQRDPLHMVTLDQKILRYTTNTLRNLIVIAENGFDTFDSGKVKQQSKDYKSEQKVLNLQSEKVSSRDGITRQTDETLQIRQNLDYGVFQDQKGQPPSSIVIGASRQDTRFNTRIQSINDPNTSLNFDSFSFHQAIKQPRSQKRRESSNSKFFGSRQAARNTIDGFGLQICNNLLGNDPQTFQSQRPSLQQNQFDLDTAASPQYFQPRKKTNLFAPRNHSLLAPDQKSQQPLEDSTYQPVIKPSNMLSVQKIQIRAQVHTDSQRAKSTGTHQRIHSNQKIRLLRLKVTSKIDSQIEGHLNNQSDYDISHKTPLVQCGIKLQQEQNQMISRQTIVNKLMKKALSPTKITTLQHSQEQSERNRQVFNPAFAKLNGVLIQAEREIEKSAERIVHRSMLNDIDKLRLYLRGETPEAKKGVPTRNFFTSYTKRLKQENSKNHVSLSERFQKAFGSLFKQKQIAVIQDILEKEKRLKTAMAAFSETKITASDAAKLLSKEKHEQIMMLLYRNRYEIDHEDRQQQELVRLVEEYCNKVYEKSDQGFMQLTLQQQASLISEDTSPRQFGRSLTLVSSPVLNMKRKQVSDYSKMSPKQRARESLKRRVVRQQTGKVSRGLAQFNEATEVDLFSSFFQQREEQMSVAIQTNQIIDKLYFNQVGKNLFDHHLTEKQQQSQQDPKINLHDECTQFGEPTLDIFRHIQNKSLVLIDYRLNPGQCEGLYKACCVDEVLIQNIVLDNCGLDDSALSRLLLGLDSQLRVNLMVLRKTKIGLESADKIVKLLKREIPYNLLEIRIENCNIDDMTLQTILCGLLQNFHLTKLVLTGLQLQANHTKLLEKFVTHARYLVKLDLSWNRFKLQTFLPLLSAICASRRLQTLNLSWNSLVENNNLGAVGSVCDDERELGQRKTYKKRKAPEVKKVNKKLAAMLGQEENSRKKEFNQFERAVVESLQQFIAHNNKLIHLDLSDTGLSEDMLLEIAKAAKFSNSLLGFHLSGNPGLSFEAEAKLLSRLNATFEKPHKLNSFFQHLNRTESPLNRVKPNKSLIETALIKNINQQRQSFYPSGVGQLDNAQRRHLILTRKLGHRSDIPGGNEWRAFTNSHEECYLCDRQIYTLFVWSPEIGIIADAEMNLSEQQKHKIAKFILMNRETNLKREQQVQIDSEIFNQKHLTKRFKLASEDQSPEMSSSSENLSRDSHDSTIQTEKSTQRNVKSPATLKQRLSKSLQSRLSNLEIQKQGTLVFDQKQKVQGRELPLLYGAFNNWQAQPMINVSLLAEYLLNEQPPDVFQQMKDEGLCDPNSKFKDLSEKELNLYHQEVEKYKNKFQTFPVWSQALRKMIPYKSPHLCGFEQLLMVEPDQIYVSANFISCGRQNYAVTFQNQIYLHQTIADFRKEEILVPKLDGKEVGRIERHPNVFLNFQVDTPAILENSSKCDLEAWKLAKFVKDQADASEVRKIVRRDYAYLKDLYMNLASQSNYPGLSCLNFTTFIDSLGIVGGAVSIGIIETQFIAARTDVENRGFKVAGQQSLDVNRFEFFEAILRVAGCVYKQQGLAATWNEALSMLIKVIRQSYQFDTQQEFRDKLLYTREVNLALDANKEGLLELYNTLTTKKQPRASQYNCLKLMTKDTSIKLAERDAIQCYALCQMTCANLVKNGFLSVGHITFVEFLELVGRVADCYLSEMEEPLEVKINFVLDEWLQLVDRQREEAQYFEEGVFDQSDEEADTKAQNQLLRLRLSKKIEQVF